MKVLSFGELLIRLSTNNNERLKQSSDLGLHFGGAEANVAVGLSQLGIESQFFTVLPNNDLAGAALAKLNSHLVDTTKVNFQDGRMGIYFLEAGKGLRPSKVVYDRAFSSISLAKPNSIDWDVVLEGVDWFHWSGITPAVSQSAADLCLIALTIAEQKGIKTSVDLNYRNKLWNYGKSPKEVMFPLIEKTDVVFGGIDAPEIYFDIVPEGEKTIKDLSLTDENICSITEQFFKMFPKASLFSTTLRETVSATHNRLQGALVTKRGQLYKSPLFDITEIVDRVGGGDAYMAGLLAGILKFEDDFQKITNYATASSVWKHTVYGDFNYVTEDEIMQIIDGASAVISR